MKNKILLDVGCGDGLEAIKYVKKGFSVICVDENINKLNLARENFKKINSDFGAVFVNKDIRNVELSDNFDLIIFGYILMFMPKSDALNLVREYYEKLNPGGRMIIKVLMSDDEAALKYSKEEKFFPTKKELILLAKEFGSEATFKVIQDDPHDNIEYKHVHSTGAVIIQK